MHLSFWERKNWFTNIDFTIAGSGIVGLHCALRLKERFPNKKILLLEKGMLPEGASTKNAGFACFGSLSEIISDLKNHSEEEVLSLVAKRKKGLELLRKRLGDSSIDFRLYGGYELFPENQQQLYETCLEKLPWINKLLDPLFSEPVFRTVDNSFLFKGIKPLLIYNPFEAQIDTGNMMQALLKAALKEDILILNNQTVTGYEENLSYVTVHLEDFSFQTEHLLFATNGFARNLTEEEVKPARAQVLITHPIPDLKIKGNFHLDEGYYYFRNVGNRILFGGGRNMDFEGETTTELTQTPLIQNQLETLLKTVILPGTDFSIDHRWSGVMGIGPQKKPIVKSLSSRIHCGVRLGGMGVAIGSLTGTELADLIL